MAATKRGNILEDLRSTIEAISSVVKCEVNSTRALHSLNDSIMPYVNIISAGTLNKDKTSNIMEVWDLSVIVWILTLDGNAEDIRGDIKVAIDIDKARDGSAVDTSYESDEDNPEFDIPEDAQSLIMNITIQYTVEGGKKI